MLCTKQLQWLLVVSLPPPKELIGNCLNYKALSDFVFKLSLATNGTLFSPIMYEINANKHAYKGPV
jgi:hypothetical protein